MKILVPTDFSSASHSALITAKTIAKASNGSILLLHVVEPPSASFSAMGENMDDDMDDVYMVKLMERVATELQAIKEANEDVSLEVHRKVGNPFTTIKDMIQEEKVDLVVMGEKGANEVEDFFIGSLTDKIVRSSHYPVITVNKEIVGDRIENLLYATDLEQEHPRLINLLKNLQQLFEAKLHIVTVNTRGNYRNDVDTMAEMRKLVDKYEIENYELKIYNHEDEETGIVFYGDEVNANIIAMGIHYKSAINRLISGGDLAVDVSDHTHRPVLTYHFNA